MQFKSWLKNENDRVLAMGMCFPFAYEKAKEWFDAHIKHPDLNNKDKFKVVHGTITDKWEKPPKPVVHGWVEMGDMVFDDQTKHTKPDGVPKELYYDHYQPESKKEFTAMEAIINCAKYGGTGPWDDDLYAKLQQRDAWLKNENRPARLQDDLFDDMFADVKAKIKKRGSVVKSQRKTEPYTFDLYHGSKADLNSLEKEGNNFILSPEKSEQGLLWFTHIFINAFDPIEYAKAHGDWVLTYPLEATKHYDEVEYEDGSIESKAPEEIIEKADPFRNNRFSCRMGYNEFCIELPEGWYWAYKMEKFIVTTNTVSFSPDMVSNKPL